MGLEAKEPAGMPALHGLKAKRPAGYPYGASRHYLKQKEHRQECLCYLKQRGRQDAGATKANASPMARRST